ncbi:MAG: glycoside hydrolase family 3 protein [Spirochaetaceae bacterium]|jgi:beta-N-acetylhexosaminidase|nr:glycoside hydrolase family 3 protein [Spirochaetaceae bacterium]
MRRRLVFPLLFLLGLRVFAQNFADPAEAEVLAASLIAAMSDEEALAQTFMLGWVGAEPSPLIIDWIRDRKIGGIKIFGWNTGDTLLLAETVGTLQRIALDSRFHIPLLVATDQEGGWIRHVKGATSETPGNMAIGASGYPLDAYYSGYYIGRELAVLGINMNFAPTVDLYTNRDSTLIGPRAFGEDPVQAGILGAAFVKGQRDAGIIATAKHYPGHGDTDLDSHGVLPQINASFEELWDRELIPYRILSREGTPAIMSGHLAFPNTQAGMAPASLSPWFLGDILRDRIRFRGLIITDDLMMNGATAAVGSVSRAAKQALMAGNDIIMFSSTPNLSDPVWTSLAASMREDPEFRTRVRDAARRVLEIKLRFLRGEKAVPAIPDPAKIAASLPDPEGQAFFLDLAARSVTVVSGERAFPLTPEQAGNVFLAGNYADFFTAGRTAFPGASAYWYPPSGESGEFVSLARTADTIIFCLSDSAGLKMLQSLKGLGKRVILFSVLSPVYLEEVSWVDASLAVYSYAPESFIAGFSAILGRIVPQGRLPFPPRNSGGR